MAMEFQKYAPINFLYERNTPRSTGITSKLKAHFFNSTGASDENWLTFDGLKDVSGFYFDFKNQNVVNRDGNNRVFFDEVICRWSDWIWSSSIRAIGQCPYKSVSL